MHLLGNIDVFYGCFSGKTPEPISKLKPLQILEMPVSPYEFIHIYEQEPNLEFAREYIAQRIERNESIILLAKNHSGLGLGFCQLYPTFCSVEAIPIYVLYDLFVRPELRRSGIGRELLLAAEAHAKLKEISRMDLTTAKNNFSAQKLYESLGWVRDEIFYTYNRHVGG